MHPGRPPAELDGLGASPSPSVHARMHVCKQLTSPGPVCIADCKDPLVTCPWKDAEDPNAVEQNYCINPQYQCCPGRDDIGRVCPPGSTCDGGPWTAFGCCEPRGWVAVLLRDSLGGAAAGCQTNWCAAGQRAHATS